VLGRTAFGAVLTRFLAAHGKRPADLRFANARPSSTAPELELGVFEVRGVDGRLLRRAIVSPLARTLPA
jgi:hypothetical protein